MNSRGYIRWLPTETSKCEVEVVPLTDPIAAAWHATVQPAIDGLPREQVRADRGWRWPRIKGLTRRFPGYAMRAIGRDGSRVLLALLQSLPRQPFPQSPGAASDYVWYLTTAPRPFLVNVLGEANLPRRLGRGILDVSVVNSSLQGHLGRIWLHAAPRGLDLLFDWYAAQGLEPIEASVRLPRVLRVVPKKNDGRYFRLREGLSDSFLAELDAFRGPSSEVH